MGNGIVEFYKTKIKKTYKIAFFSTIIVFLMIHFYKIANTLPNHDSVYNYYSSQDMTGSGRWALSLACGISSYYDLPWINGLMSSLFLAFTVVTIVAVLKIENSIIIMLAGGMLAASPATTETLFFLYTADGYMLAMFFASVSVYLSRVDEKRVLFQILSVICICISCGIYQAYVSFSLILSICYFIDVLLDNRYEKRECFKWVLRQVVIYIGAMALYFTIWQLCMHFKGVQPNDYQGISEVGKLSIGLFIHGFVSTIKTFIRYFFQWNVLRYGFSLYSILNILFLIIMIIGIINACIKSKIMKRKWAMILLILCLCMIIPFTSIWHFASASVWYRAMMLQSMTLLFVLTALLYEKWTKIIAKNIVGLFLILTVFNNAIIANICYFYMNMCYERTYAEGMEMMIKIHALQNEYEVNKIAVIGNRINEVQYKDIDLETGKIQLIGKIHVLSGLLEKTLLYDSDHTTKFLKATFGLELEPLNNMQSNALLRCKEVQDMECWPLDNSISVIDDIIIIKFSS